MLIYQNTYKATYSIYIIHVYYRTIKIPVMYKVHTLWTGRDRKRNICLSFGKIIWSCMDLVTCQMTPVKWMSLKHAYLLSFTNVFILEKKLFMLLFTKQKNLFMRGKVSYETFFLFFIHPIPNSFRKSKQDYSKV